MAVLFTDTGSGSVEPAGVGCLIAGRLILTSAAAGLLRSTGDDHVQARFPGLVHQVAERTEPQFTGYTCRQRWPTDDHADPEVVLLYIDDPQWVPPSDLPRTRWGYFTGSVDWISATLSAGTPKRVQISPLAWVRPAQWQVRTDPEPPGRPEPVRVRGLTGAALSAGDLLAGVALWEPAPGADDGGKVVAVPVAKLFTQPGFREAIAEATGQAPRLEPIELEGMLKRWLPPTPATVPAQLLDPARAVASFQDIGALLDQLTAWCATNAPFSGRLLVGPTGHGKTRLARHFAEGQYDEGWIVGDLAGVEPTDRWLRHLIRADRPVLLILDDIEDNQATAGKLASYLAEHPPRSRVRLLLTAGNSGHWWKIWRDQLGDAARAIPAEPLPLADAGRSFDCDVAWPEFVACLESLGLESLGLGNRAAAPPSGASSSGTPPSGLPASEGASVFVAQAAMLAALLDEADQRDPWDVLLDDALRRWADRAEQLPDSVRPLAERALRAALLCGPLGRGEALQVLAQLPGLSAASVEQERELLAGWVHELSTVRDAHQGYWGELLPESLRERWMARVCAESDPTGAVATDLADVVATVPARGQAAALAVIARAAAHTEAGGYAAEQMAALLRTYVADLWPPAVALACRVDVPEPVVEALVAAVEQDNVPTSLRAAIAQGLPSPAGPLNPVAVVLVARLVEESRRDATPYRLAAYLTAASTVRAEELDKQPALDAAQEAVRCYETLAEDRAAGVLPGLLAALRAVADRLVEMGRSADAIQAAQQAVGHARTLAQSDASYRVRAVSALDFLADLLLSAGEAEKAVETYEEAARWCEDSQGHPAWPMLPRYAKVVCGLSDALVAAGQPGRAAGVLDDAVEVLSQLADARPLAYRHPLAATLEVLADRWVRAGDPDAAVSAGQRAVLCYGQIAAQFPDRGLPAWAQALCRLSNLLSAAGRPAEALAAAGRSLDLYQALGPRPGAELQAERSTTAHVLSLRHAELGDQESAVQAGMEAANGFRRLVDERRGEHRPAFVAALGNLALHTGEQGRLTESEPLSQEAVTIAEELAAEGDRGYLAVALNNRAIVLGEVARERGDDPQWLTAAVPQWLTAAVDVARRAVKDLAAYPGHSPVHLASALSTLSLRLAAVSDIEGGIERAKQAVSVLGEPPADAAAEDLHRYANALHMLTEQYVQAGNWSLAATAARQTYDAYRRIPEPWSRPVHADLAAVSNLLAGLPEETVPVVAAVDAAQEAVSSYAKLAEEDGGRYREGLAAALRTLAWLFDRSDKLDEAIVTAADEVRVRRVVAEDEAARHLAELAVALGTQADRLEFRNRAEALAAAKEAYALSQRIQDPRVGPQVHAESAYRLSVLLAKPGVGGDERRSLQLAQAAVSGYEQLAGEAELFLPAYAAALYHSSRCHNAAGSRGPALVGAKRSMQVYIQAVERDPRHRLDLIYALMNYGSLAKGDGPGQQREIYQEVARHYEILYQADPVGHGKAYARALLMLVSSYDEEGRRHRADSLELHECATKVFVEVADLLWAAASGEHPDSVAARLEAVKACEEAAKELLAYADRLDRSEHGPQARDARVQAQELRSRAGLA